MVRTPANTRCVIWRNSLWSMSMNHERLRRLGPGGIHISTSTIAPETARRLAEGHKPYGVTYLAAPVLGRPEAAAAAKLWIFLMQFPRQFGNSPRSTRTPNAPRPPRPPQIHGRRRIMATKITSEVLESYLHCKFKGHLKFAGNQGTICDFESLHSELRATEWVPAVDARCPPAEKPMIPMHSGLTPPHLGVGTDHTKGPLCVVQRHKRPQGSLVTVGSAIFLSHARDAVTIEPFGNSVSLKFQLEEGSMAPTGANHHGRAVRLFRTINMDPGFSFLDLAFADRRFVVPQSNPLRLARSWLGLLSLGLARPIGTGRQSSGKSSVASRLLV